MCILVFESKSQDDQPIEKFIPTDNLTSKKDYNKAKYRPKNKNLNFIIKKDTEGILYGNPCVLEQTTKMGFQYTLQPKSGGSKTEVGRLINNFLVKLKLVLTKTPFWKAILNKRIRDCRVKSGDLVG